MIDVAGGDNLVFSDDDNNKRLTRIGKRIMLGTELFGGDGASSLWCLTDVANKLFGGNRDSRSF